MMENSIEVAGVQWKLLFQGAESRVFEGQYESRPAILKERFSKRYRLEELDKKLTKERIRAEIKAYKRLSEKSQSPLIDVLAEVLFSDDRRIIFTRIENARTLNNLLAECEEKQNKERIEQLLITLAKLIAHIHSIGLIHGDLTTSNFMVIDNEQQQSQQQQQQQDIMIVPIDFGLSYFSNSDENRAVDLYVLERAIQSTHPDVNFDIFLQQYQRQIGTDKINKRLNQVRMRGRKRSMVG